MMRRVSPTWLVRLALASLAVSLALPVHADKPNPKPSCSDQSYEECTETPKPTCTGGVKTPIVCPLCLPSKPQKPPVCMPPLSMPCLPPCPVPPTPSVTSRFISGMNVDVFSCPLPPTPPATCTLPCSGPICCKASTTCPCCKAQAESLEKFIKKLTPFLKTQKQTQEELFEEIDELHRHIDCLRQEIQQMRIQAVSSPLPPYQTVNPYYPGYVTYPQPTPCTYYHTPVQAYPASHPISTMVPPPPPTMAPPPVPRCEPVPMPRPTSPDPRATPAAPMPSCPRSCPVMPEVK